MKTEQTKEYNKASDPETEETEKEIPPQENINNEENEELCEASEQEKPETNPQSEEEAPSEDENESKEASEENEDLNKKYLRLMADFQNYKRRSEKEKNDIYSFANEKLVLQLLDIMDNFERAVEAAPADDKFAEGMKLILKQFRELLAKNNTEEIKSLGEKFDPNFHNAVMTENGGEEFESGTVTKVFQKGYTLNGKVIRPSMVAVAQ